MCFSRKVEIIGGEGTIFAEGQFDTGRLPFEVRVRKQVHAYHTLAIAVVPGESVPIVVDPHRVISEYFEVESSHPEGLTQASPEKWIWIAPKQVGLHTVVVRQYPSKKFMTLNVFVGRTASEIQNEKLQGYRIGSYPFRPLKNLESYRNPKVFVEVTKDNQDTLLSPHFRLKQFLCKQKSGYPKFIVLNERLFLKLEKILEAVNARGIRTDSFFIMSGYRTPFYNKAIGNVQYSRHVYGDAADIYVDANPQNGDMDDLNGDGKIDFQDAVFLADIVESLYPQAWYKEFIGGLGRYRRTASHPPFVHVDVRGHKARW